MRNIQLESPYFLSLKKQKNVDYMKSTIILGDFINPLNTIQIRSSSRKPGNLIIHPSNLSTSLTPRRGCDYDINFNGKNTKNTIYKYQNREQLSKDASIRKNLQTSSESKPFDHREKKHIQATIRILPETNVGLNFAAYLRNQFLKKSTAQEPFNTFSQSYRKQKYSDPIHESRTNFKLNLSKKDSFSKSNNSTYKKIN